MPSQKPHSLRFGDRGLQGDGLVLVLGKYASPVYSPDKVIDAACLHFSEVLLRLVRLFHVAARLHEFIEAAAEFIAEG